MKCNNIHTMGIPAGEDREQGIETLFEKIMTENFPNLVKEKDTEVQGAQRVLNNLDPKRSTPKYIIIRMARPKAQKRILKATREKQVVTYKEAPIRLSADFSTETFRPEGIGVKYSR